MPWVESRYRTRAYSVLVGHSYGGLFALHALVTRPDVFDAYIAISPSLHWNNQALVATAETVFESTPELTADLYMTMGNEGGAALGGMRKLAGVLDQHAPKGFRWGFRVMEEEAHGSVPLRSTRQGLESVFDGWNLHDVLPLYDLGGLAAVEDYYREGRGRFGYDQQGASPLTIYTLWDTLVNADRLDEAGAIAMRDPEKHPPSLQFLFGLGVAYARQGDDERAREYYTLALEANPENELVKQKMAELAESESRR